MSDLSARKVVAERFQLLGPLDSGRLGPLWTAVDWRNRQTVTVRFLSPYLDGLPDFRRDFLAAGTRLCELDHRGVIRGIAVGTDEEDRPLFASDFLLGRSLADRMAAGAPVPVREAAAIGAEVCEALYFLHQNRVVHGDLRPSAIRSDSDGRWVLLDPGMPAPWTREGDETSPRWASRAYQAPDVALAGPSRSTDLYSVAAILYALVTGEQPASMTTELADRLPAAFAATLTRAVAIRRDLRFVDAAEMAAALREHAQ